MAKTSCSGVLLVHDDGEVLFCTAQGRGRPCAGALTPARHRKVASCRSIYATSHCRRCVEHVAWARGAQVGEVA